MTQGQGFNQYYDIIMINFFFPSYNLGDYVSRCFTFEDRERRQKFSVQGSYACGSRTDHTVRGGELRTSQVKLVDKHETQLKKTGLYDFHLENGAKMVPFAGYSMPLSYGDVGQGMFIKS